MGTDRYTLFEGPCYCGKGSVHIEHCSPDHGWPTSTPFWYENSINCRDCNKKLELQNRGKKFVFIEKAEIAKCTAYGKEAHKRGQTLLSTPAVKKLLADLSKLLDDQKSMAAVHRLLAGERLEYYSIGTFRKRWTGAKSWVNSNISTHNLPSVMKLLNVTDKTILNEVKNIAGLWDKSQKQPPKFGKPVFSIQ